VEILPIPNIDPIDAVATDDQTLVPNAQQMDRVDRLLRRRAPHHQAGRSIQRKQPVAVSRGNDDSSPCGSNRDSSPGTNAGENGRDRHRPRSAGVPQNPLDLAVLGTQRRHDAQVRVEEERAFR